MAFGVFIHRSDSIYEDSPAERYQFPGQYLARVEACVRDWIIYYEPRKAQDSRGYFAMAKVQQVVPDPAASGMYIAVIVAGSYLEFVNSVPFRDASGLIERGLLNEHGKISGRAQSAVRPPHSDSLMTSPCCRASMHLLLLLVCRRPSLSSNTSGNGTASPI